MSHIKILSKFKALTFHTSVFTSFLSGSAFSSSFQEKHVFSQCLYIYSRLAVPYPSRGVSGWTQTRCSPQLNPDPPSTCIFSFSLSLQHEDSHQSVSLEVLLELCQLQTFFERMGGVPRSFTQECNTIGESTFQVCVRGVFSRLFFLRLVCGRMAFP